MKVSLPATGCAPPPITGLILAGGLARRMGGQGDKAWLPLAGRPLLAHVLQRLTPQLDRLVISAHGDLDRFAPFGLPVIADVRRERLGPLAGVEAAFAATDAEWILSVAVDLPFLPANLLEKMCHPLPQMAPAECVVAASADRCHWVVALWPRAATQRLTAALAKGESSLQEWFHHHPHHKVWFAPSGDAPDPFFNINRPADLQTAELWCARKRASLAACSGFTDYRGV
ncbi:MAG: molybdenum cofactor guanylyltransferase [Magnetococcus sp. MYC-9]